MEPSIAARRFKQVREELKMTQGAFAEVLGIGSTTADIERGRTKISGAIVTKLLKEYHINPLWIFGESPQKHLNPDHKDVSPRTISVDALGEENILLVNEKAAAGYAGNLGDPEYYQALPAFTFPLPEFRNATYRGFKIEGHSMLPVILPDEWIITKAVANITDIKNGNIYVIVQEDSIRIKKVILDLERRQLALISINPDYPTEILDFSDVKEVWEYHSRITQNLADTSDTRKLDEIHKEILEIKAAVVK